MSSLPSPWAPDLRPLLDVLPIALPQLPVQDLPSGRTRHILLGDEVHGLGPLVAGQPLAGTIEEAEAVVAKAEAHGVPLFSASGLQFTREIEEARPEIEKLGRVLCALAANPNELVFYGIHGLAMLYQLYGPGIESAQNIGEGSLDIVKYRWRDGRIGLQVGLEEGRPGWKLTVFGEKGRLDIPIADADYFYWNVMRHFIEMVKTGRQPLPNADMLEVIRALCLAKESKRRGTGEVLEL